MLPLAKPKLNSKALELVTECIRTGWISSQGRFVTDFEQAMSKYLEVKHCVACSSGTAALHLALRALDVWGEVLVPSFTFIATANVVKYCNAKPTFCDIDAETWCIDVEDAERKITNVTEAIIPVHINGYPADMHNIFQLALKHSLYVIEDACQALGATYGDGRKLGTISDIGCFSFFANKQLTTGEGGMAVTNNDELAEKIRILRDHGRSKEHRNEYVHDVIGFNYRMTNLQAAVGLSQMDDLDEEIARRRDLYSLYEYELTGAVFPLLGQSPWLYHHRTGNPTEAIEKLAKAGIESKPFYRPLHLQKPYHNDNVHLPVTENLSGIMLPLHDGVTDEHIKIIREVLEGSMKAK